ncbi:MAG TPA: hypothetical protein PLE85_10105 [Bacteroidales bacterium]|nr:hypothetical protein [Bacteroidales bacterium]
MTILGERSYSGPNVNRLRTFFYKLGDKLKSNNKYHSNKTPSRNLIVTTLIAWVLCTSSDVPFKEAQMQYPKVRQAYQEKESTVNTILSGQNIDTRDLNLYFRAFKSEKILELWGKSKTDTTFSLLIEYNICNTSGTLGPKRREYDLQIPEGFYHIAEFNPLSRFHLSLKIDYPNKSDRILGDKENPGSDIFIHGGCATTGCLPITDEYIKEVYIFALEARNNGQKHIPICIFPAKLSDEVYGRLKDAYGSDNEKLGLWEDLKKAYDLFNLNHTIPRVRYLSSGRHEVMS